MTTASPTPEQLAEWRHLADAATKGQWKSAWDIPPDTALPDKTIYVDDELQSPVVNVVNYNGLFVGCSQENAAFIAAARTAVPALLDENARLAAEVERLRSVDAACHILVAEQDQLRADRDKLQQLIVTEVRKVTNESAAMRCALISIAEHAHKRGTGLLIERIAHAALESK